MACQLEELIKHRKRIEGMAVSGGNWEDSYEILLWLGRTENYENIISIRHIIHMVYGTLLTAQMEVSGQIHFLAMSALG
jgi:hypothetical protein